MRNARKAVPANPWENAFEREIPSIGTLQLVGISSPTHTVFGRIIDRNTSGAISLIEVVEWMLREVVEERQQNHSRNDDNLPPLMRAEELLELGSVWLLGPLPSERNLGGKQKRTRAFAKDASSEVSDQETVRLHFIPNRFPAAYSVAWRIPDCTGSTDHHSLPLAVVVHDQNAGFMVVNKPPGLPSHATVDNGVENALYQVEKAYSECIQKPSLPQRLDTATSGLLLVATQPRFASYMGRLLQQKTTNHCSDFSEVAASASTVGIAKQYRCLVHAHSLEHRDNLLKQMEVSEGIITHYMDPSSSAPKTFVAAGSGPEHASRNSAAKDNNEVGWLKCMLRVMEVGPCMHLMGNPASMSSRKCDGTKNRVVMELTVELLTGRTHQIRGQLSALDLPLVGDPLYCGTQQLPGPQTIVEWDKTRNRVGASSIGQDAGDGSWNHISKLGLQCFFLSIPLPEIATAQEEEHHVILDNSSLDSTKKTNWEWELPTAWWSHLLVDKRTDDSVHM